MNAYFDTSKYERSHGKKPRGRGLWAFKADNDPDTVAFVTATYTEAKRLVALGRPDAKRFVVLP